MNILTFLVILSLFGTNYPEIYREIREAENFTSTELYDNASIPWQGDLVFITDKSHEFKFIIKVGYAGKIYKLGVYFRPRYAIVPYTNLFYYDEFDIYVITWFNNDLHNNKYMRKIVNVITYEDADKDCDFNLVLLEIEVPFLWDKNIWNVQFMGKSKPPPDTQCVIANIVLGNMTTIYVTVMDWNESNCSRELGFMYGCDIESFLCLSTETTIEFDTIGAPVMCDDKLVGTVPRYYIDDIIVIQYLPYYLDWIVTNSDNTLRCGCDLYIPSIGISAVVPLCMYIKAILIHK